MTKLPARGALGLACLLTAACLLLVAHVRAEPLNLSTNAVWGGAKPELLLVEVVHNGQAAGSMVIARDEFSGDHFVDVAALAAAAQIEWDESTFDTPLGSVKLPPSQMRTLDGKTMAPAGVLAELLASDIRFNQREYTLEVDTVWPRDLPGAEDVVRPTESVGELDVAAAPASVSEFRTEIYYRDSGGQDATRSLTDIGGTLGPGLWRVSIRDWVDGEAVIEDYRWLYPGDNQRLQLGNQQVSASPVLGAFNMTGAQYAWTNRPDALFNPYSTGDRLTALPSRALRTLTGEGPPGGRAELRIEGEAVARTLVALDGRFEFRDVALPGYGTALVEVWLYERGENGVPVTIKDFSGFFTRRLMPADTLLAQGAIGRSGNWIEDTGAGDGVGFGRVAWAPVDGWNIEGTVQRDESGDYTGLGTGFMAGPLGYVGVDAARGDEASAWRVELENRGDGLFWRGLWRKQQAGWRGREAELDDRFAEVGMQVGNRLTVSMIGRDYDDGREAFSFAKPAIAWRPGFNMQLRARPDFRGDYNISAYWRPRSDLYFNAYRGPFESGARATWELNRRDQLTGQFVDRDDAHRAGVIWQRRAWQLRQLGLSLGAFYGDGDPGYLAQASYEFIPGLQARAEVFRDPLVRDADGDPETVVSLNLVANFALSNRGVARGGDRYRISNRGVIAGRVRVPEGFETDLSGLVILVDNQPRGRTEAGGTFSLTGLRPGTYQVSLDPAGLPMELSGQKNRYWVEVGAGGVSRVEFEFEPRLGIAGQVTDQNDDPVAEVHVRVIAGGREVAGGRTDQFGFWRVSGLEPGDYRIEVIVAGRTVAGRDITLAEQWRFGTDFRIDREQ